MSHFRFYKPTFYLFPLLFPILNFGQSGKQNNYVEKLSACLNNPTFQLDFGICRESDSLFINKIIYNNTKQVFHARIIKANCSEIKVVDNCKINLEADAQRVGGECKRGKIVLYSFEVKKNICKFRFIDTCTNGYLELEVDKKNKSKVVGRGNF